jgi:hypothetical protein
VTNTELHGIKICCHQIKCFGKACLQENETSSKMPNLSFSSSSILFIYRRCERRDDTASITGGLMNVEQLMQRELLLENFVHHKSHMTSPGIEP